MLGNILKKARLVRQGSNPEHKREGDDLIAQRR